MRMDTLVLRPGPRPLSRLKVLLYFSTPVQSIVDFISLAFVLVKLLEISSDLPTPSLEQPDFAIAHEVHCRIAIYNTIKPQRC